MLSIIGVAFRHDPDPLQRLSQPLVLGPECQYVIG
jgi:hypothetical protein